MKWSFLAIMLSCDKSYNNDGQLNDFQVKHMFEQHFNFMIWT